MRIIKPARIREYARAHPVASPGLSRWLEVTLAAEWSNLHEVRQSFRHADEVKTSSGRSVVVFNIAGNAYRLITAIHYNTQKVFVLRLLTHADYSKDRWKEQL